MEVALRRHIIVVIIIIINWTGEGQRVVDNTLGCKAPQS